MDKIVQGLISKNYVPVGTVLSKAQIAELPDDFLINREILDPAYAGFEKNFQWKKYITIDSKDPILSMRVTGALNQFAETPEGQHVIRQAAAMQAYRQFGTISPNAKQQEAAKLIISDGGTSQYNVLASKLFLNRAQIEGIEYIGVDKRNYDASIQGVLFHEMLHAADGFITVENTLNLLATKGKPFMAAAKAYEKAYRVEGNLHFEEIYSKQHINASSSLPSQQSITKIGVPAQPSIVETVKNWWQQAVKTIWGSEKPAPESAMPIESPLTPIYHRGKKEKWEQTPALIALKNRMYETQERYIAKPIEYAAMKKTNEVMGYYFHEPARIMNHQAIHVEDPRERYKTQPGLGGDHYYDSIDLPKLPFKPLKPERGSR